MNEQDLILLLLFAFGLGLLAGFAIAFLLRRWQSTLRILLPGASYLRIHKPRRKVKQPHA